MKDFKDNIMAGIKKGEIRAESKWRFLAHDYFFWFLTVAFVAFGGLSVASILHRIAMEQVAPLRAHFAFDSVPIFIQTLPYLWIFVFVVLLFAAWFNFKKTSGSYRHQGFVLLGGVITSLVLGVVLFATGTGGHIDKQVRDRVPLFEREHIRKQKMRRDFLERRQDREILNTRDYSKQPYPTALPQRIR